MIQLKIQNKSKFNINVLLIGVAAVLVILGVISMFLQLVQYKRLQNVYPEVVVEAGTESIHAAQFLKEQDKSKPVFLTDVADISLDVPNTSKVQIEWHGKAYKSVLKVKDTVPPAGSVHDITSYHGVPNAKEFVTEFSDISPVSIRYGSMPCESCEGPQIVTIFLTDSSGNRTKLHASLTIIHDVTAPVMEGVQDSISVYTGETVSYRQGVTVSDDIDKNVQLMIDSDQVDLSKPGKYKVTYSATDSSGNTTSAESIVNVVERPAEYEDKDIIWQEIDEIIDKIITDDMTAKEQVEAIYHYVRSHFSYGKYPVKVDYLQAAHFMIIKGYGDCYNYFGVAKAMYERLEIPNIDVIKVKNSKKDSNHFWSLVSVDGGKTYYHVDPTPRKYGDDNFCLVTDKQLDAYSRKHNNCHNRDMSLYPATPEE